MIKLLKNYDIGKAMEEEAVFIIINTTSDDYEKHCKIKLIQTIAEATFAPMVAIQYTICNIKPIDTEAQTQITFSMKNGMDLDEISIFINANFQLLSQHRETKIKSLLKYL